jgi:nitronate monooxygenase
MRQSVVDAGIDPTDLTPKSKVDFGDELELGNQNSSEKKAWRDIWSAGQGVGSIDKVL